MRRHRRSAAPDESVRDILIIGPWQHREITANGIRFHLATGSGFSRDRPLVLLLHGFGEFWWAWRHQLPVVGRRRVQCRRGRSPGLRCDGQDSARLPPVRHGPGRLGGDPQPGVRRPPPSSGTTGAASPAWSTYAYAPEQVSAMAAIGAPHPLRFPWRSMGTEPGLVPAADPARARDHGPAERVRGVAAPSAGRSRRRLPDERGGRPLPAGVAALAESALRSGVSADVRPGPASRRGTDLSSGARSSRAGAGADRTWLGRPSRPEIGDAAAVAVRAAPPPARGDPRRRPPPARGGTRGGLGRPDRLACPLISGPPDPTPRVLKPSRSHTRPTPRVLEPSRSGIRAGAQQRRPESGWTGRVRRAGGCGTPRAPGSWRWARSRRGCRAARWRRSGRAGRSPAAPAQPTTGSPAPAAWPPPRSG